MKYKKLTDIVEIAKAMKADECWVVSLDGSANDSWESAGTNINQDIYDYYTREKEWIPEKGEEVYVLDGTGIYSHKFEDKHFIRYGEYDDKYFAVDEVKPLSPKKVAREGWVHPNWLMTKEERDALGPKDRYCNVRGVLEDDG